MTKTNFFLCSLHVLVKPVDGFDRTPVTSHCYLTGILAGIVCSGLEFIRMWTVSIHSFFKDRGPLVCGLLYYSGVLFVFNGFCKAICHFEFHISCDAANCFCSDTFFNTCLCMLQLMFLTGQRFCLTFRGKGVTSASCIYWSHILLFIPSLPLSVG